MNNPLPDQTRLNSQILLLQQNTTSTFFLSKSDFIPVGIKQWLYHTTLLIVTYTPFFNCIWLLEYRTNSLANANLDEPGSNQLLD